MNCSNSRCYFLGAFDWMAPGCVLYILLARKSTCTEYREAKRMESGILQSGFILAGSETRGKLPTHPLLYFSHLQDGDTGQGMVQVCQTSKTACVSEAISDGRAHPVFPAPSCQSPSPSFPCLVRSAFRCTVKGCIHVKGCGTEAHSRVGAPQT